MLGGGIKVYDRIVRSIATAALAKERLEKLGSFTWIAVAVACGLALPATAYGLVGVVYAVNAGWLTNMLIGLIQLVASHCSGAIEAKPVEESARR